MLNNKAAGDWNLFKGKVKEKARRNTYGYRDTIVNTHSNLIKTQDRKS